MLCPVIGLELPKDWDLKDTLKRVSVSKQEVTSHQTAHVQRTHATVLGLTYMHTHTTALVFRCVLTDQPCNTHSLGMILDPSSMAWEVSGNLTIMVEGKGQTGMSSHACFLRHMPRSTHPHTHMAPTQLHTAAHSVPSSTHPYAALLHMPMTHLFTHTTTPTSPHTRHMPKLLETSLVSSLS